MDRFTQERLVDSLAANELLIGELYSGYSKIYPAWTALWSQMSQEEASHAEWIRAVYRAGETVDILVSDPSRFGTGELDSFASYIKDRIAEVKTSIVPLDRALAVALDIENALIEKRFFEVFTGDTSTLVKTFTRLAEATESHKKKLEEALAQLQSELS